MIAKTSGAIDLGDVKADSNTTRPYVPPTPAERAAQAFAPRSITETRRRLDDLLASADREYTRPLLLLGSPTDKACVELFRLFDEAPADDDQPAAERIPSPRELRWEFELLSLDDSQPEARELAAQLGIQRENADPILAILTAAGSLTATLPLRLTGDQLSGAPLSRFLAAHKRPTRNAETMLADGLRRALAEDKRLFFIFSASWCGPCRKLSEFLTQHKAALEPHFVSVKLDASRDDHAQALREKYKESKSGGVPWYTILDAQGKLLTTSNAQEKEAAGDFGNSNIGFPSEPKGIEHFLNMLQATAPRLTPDQLSEIRAALLKPN